MSVTGDSATIAPRPSAAQRRALSLQRASGEGSCVQLDVALAGWGELAALRARVAEVLGSYLPAIRSGGAVDVPVHRLDVTGSASGADARLAAIAHDQRRRTRAAAFTGAGMAQAEIVVLDASTVRVLLAAPRWSADADSLRVIARRIVGADAGTHETPAYADLVALQAELLDDPEADAERSYWRDAAQQAATFVVDGQAGTRRHTLDVAVPASAGDALVRSDEAFFLACWLQLLHARFGDGSTVGCRLSPREIDGLADMIGPLAISAPVSFGITGAPLPRRQRDVAERLARAREYCLHHAHDDVAADGTMRAARCAFSFVELDAGQSLHDDGEPDALRLDVTRAPDGVSLRIVFDEHRHGPDEIAWLGRQYLALLLAALAAPERRLDEHDLGDAEQHAFVADAGRGPVLSIAETDFVARFAAVVARAPEAPALHAGALRLSYTELDRWSHRIARLLLEEGMRPGQRIGICLPRSARQVASMLGVMKAGCTCVPIDPAYPAQRIARIVAQADVALIVTATEHLDRVSDSDAEIPLIDWDRDADHIDGLDADPVAVAIHPEQIAYAIFTSGSTGEPKGVEVSHRALTNYVAGIGERLQMDRIASIAALATVAADLGYTALFGGLGNGSCLRVFDESLNLDAAALADELDAAPVDCLKIVPSHLAALLSLDTPRRVLPRECIVLGGEALPWDLVQRLRALSPTLRVVNHYGPTETTIGITCNVDLGDGARASSVGLGPPLANDRTYVLAPDLGRCAVGIEGELCLAGDSVAAGYLGRPAETAAKFLPDPHATRVGARMYASGDRAVFDGSGALRFRGRADQQVKLRGHRVELGEIEAEVRACGRVHECAVVVSELGGQARLVAYAVGDGSAESVARDHLAARLPEHMQPVAWVWLDRLPLNANGKLDRRALPAPEHAARAAAEPTSPVEARLLALCRELLGNPRIGVDDNFFAIGADSIVAIQLVARARQAGLFFRPKQVFEQQTIARLAAVAEQRDDTAGSEQKPVVGDAPLTAIQARFFASVAIDRHHYNQACLYELPSASTSDALRDAASRLLQHHDGLRTTFLQDADGRWRQQLPAWTQAQTDACCEQVCLPGGDSRDAALGRLVERVQSGFVLAEAPLLRLVRIDDADGGAPLLLAVAHHLVVDSFSWRVIEEDLHALLANPAAVLPPKTCSVNAWAERERAALGNGAWDAEAAYWATTEQAFAPPPLLEGEDRVGDAVSRRLVLPDELGAALSGTVHAAYNTNTQDFLLAALLAACAEWTGEDTLGVMLEGHGRDADDVDCGRTVGWFTAMYPVALRAARDARGEHDPIALLTAVKEQLRAVPGQGSGYAALRYLAGQGSGGRAAEPALCFNYLGRFGASAGAAQLQASSAMHIAQHATRSVAQRRLFALEVLAMQQGDSLLVTFVYNPARIADATIEQLCVRMQAALTGLVAACAASAGGFTPSDVPDLHLQQDDLDALLAELSDVV